MRIDRDFQAVVSGDRAEGFLDFLYILGDCVERAQAFISVQADVVLFY